MTIADKNAINTINIGFIPPIYYDYNHKWTLLDQKNEYQKIH